jgi:hypothetical protein
LRPKREQKHQKRLEIWFSQILHVRKGESVSQGVVGRKSLESASAVTEPEEVRLRRFPVEQKCMLRFCITGIGSMYCTTHTRPAVKFFAMCQNGEQLVPGAHLVPRKTQLVHFVHGAVQPRGF